MYAFYLARGWKFEELLALSFIQKSFMRHAVNKYYEEQRLNESAAIATALCGESGVA